MYWPLKQFDVKNVFLHQNMEEEVYVVFQPSYGASSNIGVYRLRKSFYGLKQLSHVWFDRFTQAMKKYGYCQIHSNHTLFMKRRYGKNNCFNYVNDMIITGDDSEEIRSYRQILNLNWDERFEDLKYFLVLAKTCVGFAKRNM